MNSFILRVTSCAALALASTYASSACYTIYNGQGKLVQQTAQPPVTMGGDLRRAVTKKFGTGASMVFESQVTTACEDIVAETRKHSTEQKSQNVNAVLDELARQHLERSGTVQWRTDRWLADMKFSN